MKVDHLDEVKVRRKVRSPSKPRSAWERLRKSARSFVSGGGAGRVLLFALGVYLFIQLYNWDDKVDFYGVLTMEDDRAAVRYALGSPDVASRTDRLWTYRLEGGSTLTTSFGNNGKLVKINCVNDRAEPDSCPDLFGFGIGDIEDALIGRLGLPSRVRIVGDRKYLDYDGIGATYALEQFIVVGLERKPQGGSFLGKTWGFFRSLIYLPGARI
jgi:hypothetical protein